MDEVDGREERGERERERERKDEKRDAHFLPTTAKTLSSLAGLSDDDVRQQSFLSIPVWNCTVQYRACSIPGPL